MTLPRCSPLQRVVFVLALISLALLVSLLLKPLIQPDFFLPFTAAVLLSAWFCGSRAGLLAIALSCIVVDYFFFAPVLSLAIVTWNAAVRLITFASVSLLLTWLIAALRDSKDVLDAALSSIGDAVIASDRDGRVAFLNRVAEELTGWRQSEAKGKPISTVLHIIDGKTRQEVRNAVERVIRDGEIAGFGSGAVLISKDGTEIPVEDSAAPIRDKEDKLHGVILVFRDVTGRKQLEEQLSQVRKMDAVGRLAAGVAGDFNNVLTVITGYSELLRSEIPSTNPLRRFAEEILYAAERAAGLTRQLLTFGRSQAAQPKLLDLNGILTNMQEMLRRMLGDNIELIVLFAPDLGRVRADPVQIEQIVMNLANNARDAMPAGGKLVIETSNVELDESGSKKIGVKPGSCVMLVVTDSGRGMDPDTRSRIFEPFFTTKERGKGSGLGLSTVYGIVRQNEGQITVYSQLGAGTIFEIYLPRATEVAEPVHRAKASVLPKGSETILIVDDEEGVRKLVFAILKSNGYDVIEARNGPEALTAFEKNQHKIDLVLTDVVMPEMTGFELGGRLEERKPAAKILYMSGYRDSTIGNHQPQRPFLHKPFTPEDLLTKIRELLDTRSEDAYSS